MDSLLNFYPFLLYLRTPGEALKTLEVHPVTDPRNRQTTALFLLYYFFIVFQVLFVDH